MFALFAVFLTFSSFHTVYGETLSTQDYCITKLGKVSVANVPRYTVTVNVPITVLTKVTTTPVQTLTPPPVVTTSLSTATSATTKTLPAETRTVTKTNSRTTTRTTTTTTTITSVITTTTEVTSTSTTTIPTPPGFTPISLQPDYVPKIKGRSAANLEKRDDQHYSGRVAKGGSQIVFSPAIYPKQVYCIRFEKPLTTKTLTLTAPATSTTTLPPGTSTTTSTTTEVSTSTYIPPDVTVTRTTSTLVTITTTKTSTTSTVTTTTTTQTALLPGPTVYAACTPANIINRANGGGLIDTFDTPALNFIGYTNNPTECCEACQRTPNCHGSIFYPNAPVRPECYTLGDTGCQPGVFQGEFYQTEAGDDPRAGLYVSNGPCGGVENRGKYPF